MLVEYGSGYGYVTYRAIAWVEHATELILSNFVALDPLQRGNKRFISFRGREVL
jgi:hypothetical protein